jgi:hypothetical protein
MAEPSSPRSLQELGPAALGELHGWPALVHCSRAGGEGSWGFETRTVAAPWDARVALALARGGRVADPELLSKAGAAYAIIKRPGGPFPDRIGVGRARTADISLRYDSVSKYHAYFTCDEAEQHWTLWDARSRNGTMVSNQRLSPGSSAPVENGSALVFGEELFLFFTKAGFAALLGNLAQRVPAVAANKRHRAE